jgi:hypothetical protein
MPPEEPPRPKGPKVEPIDRRGKLMAFKRSLRREAAEDLPVEKPNDETPYERLKRLETDPAANLQELQATLTHFVPHLQLVEIESMLSKIVAEKPDEDGQRTEAPKGLFNLLAAYRNHPGAQGSRLGLGHRVRNHRNELFHGNRTLTELARHQITSFWEQLRAITNTGESTAVKIQRASAAPLNQINHSQRVAGDIAHVAAFIEIEQALRKTMEHVLSRNPTLRATFVMPVEPAGSNHAMNAISLSRGLVADCLMNFMFWEDIKTSIRLRHDLIHGRNLSQISDQDKRVLRRAWGVLRHLPYAVWAKKIIGRLEMLIRDLLISEGVGSEVVRRLWIQRLSKRLCDEKRCMVLLANAGVGRNQILWLAGFSDAIFDGTLEPITSVDVSKLQTITLGISKALANPLLIKNLHNSQITRHDSHKDIRNRRKHPKARRGRIETD